ncbi:MAG: hypothetical protein IPK92_06685 [Nitrospira sp.]|nr:hypothetical protein [Nitrospira sp.]MBL8052555.1 hypothetical protein [Nitrospira sp.]
MLTWCCRLLIGVLLASALGKSLDLRGFVDVLVTYRLFTDWSLWGLVFGIMGIEWSWQHGFLLDGNCRREPSWR